MTEHVLVVTGTRADFGLWEPVLDELSLRGTGVEVRLVVMAMHLDERFGRTANEVRLRGIPIAGEVPCIPESDTRAEMAAGLGKALQGVAPIIADARPDWLMLLGDRGEQAAAALAALHLGVPVAHVHGGERTLGAVDDVLRDVITRIAHLHLVATRGARERLLALGEDRWRIHRTGGPGLDALVTEPRIAPAEARARYGLPSEGPYLLVVIHPETGPNAETPSRLVEAVLQGSAVHRLPAVAIWPNADAGGRAIGERLELERPRLSAVAKSIPRDDYVALLRDSAALVGNSSSGIIEAPLLRVPAVNVGRRQHGRERGDNVLDVDATAEAVAVGVERALEPGFRSGLSGRSPYGDGRAARRIVDALLGTPRDRRLMEK